MTFSAAEVYDLLEPLLKDFRKIRLRNMSTLGTFICCRNDLLTYVTWVGGYSLTFMDEYVDQLLTEERVCDIILPRLQKRAILEENGELGPRKSRLLDAMEGRSDAGSARSRSRSRSRSSSGSARSRSRSGSRGRSRSAPLDAGSRYVSRSRSRSRSKSVVSDAGSRYVSRSPSRSRSRARSGSKSPAQAHSRSRSPERVDVMDVEA